MSNVERKQAWLHQGIITLIASMVFFVNLGGPKLWDRDETRNARCTVEMLERGDWVVPYFNGQIRDIKPAGMYWCMMSAVSVFGPTEFAFRFWSAVAGLGTALATYHIGRRLFTPEVGLWAGVILVTSMMFAVLARTAKVDSLLILFSTLAMLVFVLATFRPSERSAGQLAGPTLRWPGQYYPQSPWIVALMFALMGAAVLGKGPIGVVLPTAVIGMFLLLMRQPAAEAEQPLPEPSLRWQRGGILLTAGWLVLGLLVTKISLELGPIVLLLLAIHLFVRRLPIFRPFAPGHFLATCWSMRPLTAIAATLLVALPWHLWVAFRDMSWIEGFYLVNNLGRATNSMEHHSGSDLLYYPATIALGLVPWSMFLVPVIIDWVRRIRRQDPWRIGLILMTCWVGVYIGLFSLARTKLPNYVVSAYPAMALLTACYIYHLRHSTAASAAWWPRAAMGVLAFTGLGLLIGLPIAASIYLPGEQWLGIVGLIPIAGAVVCYTLFRKDRARTATVCFAGCAVVLVVALVAGVAQRVDRHQRILVLVEAAFERSEEPQFASFACLEPSWVHYCRQNIHEFPGDETREAREFLESGPDRFLLTNNESWEALRPELPPDAAVIADCPRFMKDERLLLIGREPSPRIAEEPAAGVRLR